VNAPIGDELQSVTSLYSKHAPKITAWLFLLIGLSLSSSSSSSSFVCFAKATQQWTLKSQKMIRIVKWDYWVH